MSAKVYNKTATFVVRMARHTLTRSPDDHVRFMEQLDDNTKRQVRVAIHEINKKKVGRR